MKDEFFCFVQDNDTHWYAIPVKLKKKFYKMLDNGHKDHYTKFIDKFGGCLLGMSPSNYCFTNLEEING